MAKNSESGETSEPFQLNTTAPTPNPDSDNETQLRRRNNPVLIIYNCFSLVTAISAVLCISVNALAAVISFKNGSDVFDGVLRIYAVVIAVFVVVSETEWTVFFKFCKVLKYWPGRAMLQIFYLSEMFHGVCNKHFEDLVMTRAFPDYDGQRKDLALLQNIASYLLLSCGVVYLVSGILCLGFLKRRLERKGSTNDQAVKDVEDVARKKEELEALLIDTRV